MAVQVKTRRAAISWEGDSRQVLREWPKPIREDFGVALAEMQDGRTAALPVRPMPSIAAGVFELKNSDKSKWYRLVYLARVKTPSTSCIASPKTLPKPKAGSGNSRTTLEISAAKAAGRAKR